MNYEYLWMLIFRPSIFPLIITLLFAAGAIRYAFALDWPMTIYHACAAGLQLAVLSMGGK